MALDSPGRDPTPAEVGNIGEQLARIHLEAKGYRVVETNYRCRWGEVDLITRDGPIWVFVEVRARRGDALVSPEESVTPEKALRLTMAAQDYLEQHQLAADDILWRIDLVAIRLGPRRRVLDIRHLENVVEG